MSNGMERAPKDWQQGALVIRSRTWYASVMSNDEHAIDPTDPQSPGSFAVRLWHARNAVPLTQAEVAAIAGLQQSAIAHYEAGRREPSLANIRRLAWALGCGADYLLATRRGTDEAYRDDGYVTDAQAAAREDLSPAGARKALLEHLATGMHAALISGDLETARVAHGALGCLLAAPGGKTDVIDLAAERDRRNA
jgi:transcriptional regulator with XRE-family HTH domain